jgi:hypothetical protein
MAYVVIPTRTTADDNTSADINQLMANDVAVKAIAEGITPAINPNILINGGFDVWQRGTSFVSPSSLSFTCDRFKVIPIAGGGTFPTVTHSKEISHDLYGAPNTYRITVDGAGSSFGTTSQYVLQHKNEFGVRNYCGTSKQITLSFYAKSNISGKRLGMSLAQNYGTGGSPSTEETLTGQIITLTSTYQRFIYTFTTNTLTGKTFGSNNDDSLKVNIRYVWGTGVATTEFGGGTAETFGGAGYIDIKAVKLEEGSTATDFQVEPYGDVLLKCKRYFNKCIFDNLSTAPEFINYTAWQQFYSYPSSGGALLYEYDIGQPMRIKPTVTSTGFIYDSIESGNCLTFEGYEGSATTLLTASNTPIIDSYCKETGKIQISFACTGTYPYYVSQMYSQGTPTPLGEVAILLDSEF